MFCKIGGEQTWSSTLSLCHYDEQALSVVMVAIKARLTQADTVWHMIMAHNFRLWTADYPPPFCSPPTQRHRLLSSLPLSASLLPSPTFHTNNSKAKDTLRFIILYLAAQFFILWPWPSVLVLLEVCCHPLLMQSITTSYSMWLVVTNAARAWPWLFSYRRQAWMSFSLHWTPFSKSTSRPKSRRSVTKKYMSC